MSWTFTVPGQPVTTNHGYKTGLMAVKRGGRPVFNDDMSQKMIHRPILTDEARAWRDTVEMICRLACPKNYAATVAGLQLRIIIDLRLAGSEDADGTEKFILDGIKRAIKVDDRWFLPCVRSMQMGRRPTEACAIITIEEVR